MFLLKTLNIAIGIATIIAINGEFSKFIKKELNVIPKANMTTTKNQTLRKISARYFIKNNIRKTAIAIANTRDIKVDWGVTPSGGSIP